MSKAKCPKCKRETWSEKFHSCSACGFTQPTTVTLNVTKGTKVTPDVTNVPPPVTPTVTEPCGRCGCTGHGAKSGAERQKAYRERRKNE